MHLGELKRPSCVLLAPAMASQGLHVSPHSCLHCDTCMMLDAAVASEASKRGSASTSPNSKVATLVEAASPQISCSPMSEAWAWLRCCRVREHLHQVHSQPVVQPVRGRGHIRTPSDIEAMRPAELRYAPTVGACLPRFSSCTAACCARQSSDEAPTAIARIGYIAALCAHLKKKKVVVLWLDLWPKVVLAVSWYSQPPCCCLRSAEAGPEQPQQPDRAALSLKQSCYVALSCPASLGGVSCPGFQRFWQHRAVRGGRVRCPPCIVLAISQIDSEGKRVDFIDYEALASTSSIM